jgi:UDP-N-acetylglucosamine/UDP-N-acetylgalactosamine 4-epimerase
MGTCSGTNEEHPVTTFEQIKRELIAAPRTWLVTGVAGFIGSHLLEELLVLGQRVVGIDNFVTGQRRNLDEVSRNVPPKKWAGLTFLEGDILDPALCRRAADGVDYVLHQAALGSVPRSIDDPVRTNEVNVTGFLNMLVAARDNKVKRFVYASSSSVYGDASNPVNAEASAGRPLSPYAATKVINEIYAGVFARSYGLKMIGLRYFNVFGPRQDPSGPYAAVIPKWLNAMMNNETVHIYGDGSTSRDFCYVANIVQANLLAATSPNAEAVDRVFNIANGCRTSLNELFAMLQRRIAACCSHLTQRRPEYLPFRPGDILHSQADISLAQNLLGYAPTHDVEQGLDLTLQWHKSVAEAQQLPAK